MEVKLAVLKSSIKITLHAGKKKVYSTGYENRKHFMPIGFKQLGTEKQLSQ